MIWDLEHLAILWLNTNLKLCGSKCDWCAVWPVSLFDDPNPRFGRVVGGGRRGNNVFLLLPSPPLLWGGLPEEERLAGGRHWPSCNASTTTRLPSRPSVIHQVQCWISFCLSRLVSSEHYLAFYSVLLSTIKIWSLQHDPLEHFFAIIGFRRVLIE